MPTPHPSVGPLALPVFAISRLGRITNEKVRAAFSHEKLSWRGHFILVCLKEQGQLSQRELADVMSMDASDLVKVLDALEQTSLLRRQPDPRDRRRHVLSMTVKGKNVCRRGEQLIRTVTDELLAPFTPDQREAFHDFVTTVIDAHNASVQGDR